MTWQPGDVSPDARRAAEAAAEAAGVPLKDWFAEVVRAAILRELGHMPVEEAAPTREPSELVSEPVDPPVSVPELLAPRSIVAGKPTASAPIPEPAPVTAEPRDASSIADRPAKPPRPKAAPDAAAPALSLPSGPVTILPLTSLRPARIRARHVSDADPAVPALAASVASHGVREAVLVRRLAENPDEYEVVVGERRRVAAEHADRADLPALIVEADDAEALLLSLTENLGRGDFSPLDEARAYLRLLTEYRMSPGALAQRLARDRSHIALALRLLGLPPTVRQLIDSGRLAPAQVFALLGVSDPDAMAEQMMEANRGGVARNSG